jgi:hypothetical protein
LIVPSCLACGDTGFAADEEHPATATAAIANAPTVHRKCWRTDPDLNIGEPPDRGDLWLPNVERVTGPVTGCLVQNRAYFDERSCTVRTC